MVAAGKFFESSFGLNYLAGMLIVAAITMVYTLFGGFLGATLTDVAQGLLMFADTRARAVSMRAALAICRTRLSKPALNQFDQSKSQIAHRT